MIMLESSCSASIAWMRLLAKNTLCSQLSCGTTYSGVTGPYFTYWYDVGERATLGGIRSLQFCIIVIA